MRSTLPWRLAETAQQFGKLEQRVLAAGMVVSRQSALIEKLCRGGRANHLARAQKVLEILQGKLKVLRATLRIRHTVVKRSIWNRPPPDGGDTVEPRRGFRGTAVEHHSKPGRVSNR
jgi:hypothetical protein